ncbi:hypothetical protein DY000_02025711 [Brassica cretica]|uniref:Uncharacterized protein n=1 Tax=Brassica cretica TaxID=69181 RepID=A0ABQ7EJA5_BRACR|nr:hypothetical protein DY000_02025711 [Brassica cretica]
MADGEYCSLSLDKLNEIYETATEPKGVAVAKKFSPSNAFWDCIANGNFTPGKAPVADQEPSALSHCKDHLKPHVR